MNTSAVLASATTNPIVEDESQSSQLKSVPEEPEIVGMEEEEERLDDSTAQLNKMILLRRPIVVTSKGVPEKVVTGATKGKAKVV